MEIPEKGSDIRFTKTAGNVKKVNIPAYGDVYVCPYPPSDFPDTQKAAKAIIYAKKGIKRK
ncbi:MAG: hypothetical protein ACD_38C00154G0010 [uncultured bacterium]|uniref:Uncharacterized protein n=1 Tax=Candidatus Daviesbacteria bacterium GW2011_GWC2_40_12 TaxID=1618431 RepID=A0A0G0TWQ5_9BACT|nr:MAG: hypothetical protein ACD_38C00154G0010 [uncultured bacterium]KKQ85514.1 MAG: hypothetical protein UT04_C0003G0019 [Candidatus Daviesbacteria bacterium GW2011_GWF2_38_7]KKR16806.1 MAG: hypothetical protein UT45_C0004G0137 [Candidatus Daviesbacteria bacterium GW2011_GWA2_39_33]KKR24630.1 MAG: hypothetical protein UT54_C0015G0007 [Candidatus Daviesbacteria bacterium GW2011_GWB1_39_5]KKR42412.1 MAG: hypothetical protein UT77_C0002G0065 [Candidatus Daviesbacteria bacterium GW2011_GWC2_40_12]